MSQMALSEVKAHLSEVVRNVRESGVPVEVTVDGRPAVRIVPAVPAGGRMTPAEVSAHDVLLRLLLEMPRSEEPFDAVTAVRDGRR